MHLLVLLLGSFGMSGGMSGGMSAHAAVVDRFDCQVRYAPVAEGRVVESNVELAAARRPTLATSGANTSFTEGSAGASLSVQGERFQTAFQLVYLHAVKRSAGGQVLRAAQHVCLSHTYLVGEKGVSADCRPACDDAFDPKCKWVPVQVRNGVPVFDPKPLTPVSQTLTQGGTLALSCHYQGTLE